MPVAGRRRGGWVPALGTSGGVAAIAVHILRGRLARGKEHKLQTSIIDMRTGQAQRKHA